EADAVGARGEAVQRPAVAAVAEDLDRVARADEDLAVELGPEFPPRDAPHIAGRAEHGQGLEDERDGPLERGAVSRRVQDDDRSGLVPDRGRPLFTVPGPEAEDEELQAAKDERNGHEAEVAAILGGFTHRRP